MERSASIKAINCPLKIKTASQGKIDKYEFHKGIGRANCNFALKSNLLLIKARKKDTKIVFL